MLLSGGVKVVAGTWAAIFAAEWQRYLMGWVVRRGWRAGEVDGPLLSGIPPSVTGKGTWACFECRLAVRRELHDLFSPPPIVPCSRCGQPCRFLGTKIPVPPKRKPREWEALRESLDRQAIQEMEDARR